MKSTGEKIRDQRRILGMTQQELAEAAGMTNRTVSKYETDMVVPRGMNLKKLCSVLHVSQAYLLTPDIEDPSYGLDEAPYVEAAHETYGKKAANDLEERLTILKNSCEEYKRPLQAARFPRRTRTSSFRLLPRRTLRRRKRPTKSLPRRSIGSEVLLRTLEIVPNACSILLVGGRCGMVSCLLDRFVIIFKT